MDTGGNIYIGQKNRFSVKNENGLKCCTLSAYPTSSTTLSLALALPPTSSTTLSLALALPPTSSTTLSLAALPPTYLSYSKRACKHPRFPFSAAKCTAVLRVWSLSSLVSHQLVSMEPERESNWSHV